MSAPTREVVAALDYLVSMAIGHDYADAHKIDEARDIIADQAARLAAVEALPDRWNAGLRADYRVGEAYTRQHVSELRDALAADGFDVAEQP